MQGPSNDRLNVARRAILPGVLSIDKRANLNRMRHRHFSHGVATVARWWTGQRSPVDSTGYDFPPLRQRWRRQIGGDYVQVGGRLSNRLPHQAGAILDGCCTIDSEY